MATVQVWDPLIRIFHWAVAIVFVANYFFNEKGGGLHVALGYTAAGMLALRFAWGFVSRGAARWSDFFPTPSQLVSHSRSLLRGEGYRRLGHTPLGAVVMILMMSCLAGLATTGYMMEETDMFWGVEWVKDLHWGFATTLLGLVIVHILGALYESYRLKENLPLSMITGRRRR